MKTWLTILLVVVLVTVLIVALAAICAVVLLHAGKRHGKRMEEAAAREIARYLPGCDCGSCAQGSCIRFADQTARQGSLAGECPFLSPEAQAQIEAYFEKREADFQAYRDAVRKADTAAGIRRKE